MAMKQQLTILKVGFYISRSYQGGRTKSFKTGWPLKVDCRLMGPEHGPMNRIADGVCYAH